MASSVIIKDFMGALAAAMALAAYGIYVWKTLHGEARPHPLSWLIFGILTGTGYLVQLDQAAGPGSWVMGITAAVCLLLCLMSFWRGERAFPWYEWAFLVAAAIVFGFYLWSREPALVAATLSGALRDFFIRSGPAISASLAAGVSVLGLRPDRDQGVGPAGKRQRHHLHAQRREIRAVAVRHGNRVGRDLRVSGDVADRQSGGGSDHLRAALS